MERENIFSDIMKPFTEDPENVIPMKMRALPSSFWHEPNKSPESPSTACSSTSVDNQDHPSISEIKGEPNIDLLFSLFQYVEPEKTDEDGNSKGLKGLKCVRSYKKNFSKVTDPDSYGTSATMKVYEDEKLTEENQVSPTILTAGECGNLASNHLYVEKLTNFVKNL